MGVLRHYASIVLSMLLVSPCATTLVEVGVDGSLIHNTAVKTEPAAMEALFDNPSPHSVDLWWMGDTGDVKLSTIGPRSSLTLNTFTGHTFYMCQEGQGRSAILEQFSMTEDASTYSLENFDVSTSIASEIECEDRRDTCPAAARRGDCQRTPGWMIMNCPHSCNACHLLDPKVRCDRTRMGVSNSPSYQPGEMNSMFESIPARFPELEPKIVHTSPYVVVFENFLNDTEAEAIFGAVAGQFHRSTDTGAYNKFGEAAQVVSQGRTSENAWCREGCDSNPLVRGVIERIENVTLISYENYEQFQVLRYEPGQYYRVHHDYGVSQKRLACGPRILTFFLYLSDVEEGGETHFPRLDIKVKPKKGRAVLWPSVMDDNLEQQEPLTHHEAMPVIKGVKKAANAWIHLYNFHTPNHWGCTGAFD